MPNTNQIGSAAGKFLFGVIIGFVAFFVLASTCSAQRQAISSVVPAANVTVEMAALEAYPQWWSDVEQCMGLRGDLSQWTWYSVEADAFTVNKLGDMLFVAYTFKEGKPETVPGRGHRIYVTNGHLLDPVTIRHEMLHALGDVNGLETGHHSKQGDSLFTAFKARANCIPTARTR